MTFQIGNTLGTRHGQTNTPEYECWSAMVQRCTNKNSPAYPRYGGRGVELFAAWRKYINFKADMGNLAGPHGVIRFEC